MPQQNVMGVDVSKDWLDIDTQNKGPERLRNSQKGFVRILQFIRASDIEFVVLEATGGYERDLVRFLVDKGVDVGVANPRQVRDFARSLGILAKTDRLDASVLRTFGEVIPLASHARLPRNREVLAALVKQRMHLVRLIGQEKRRVKRVDPAIRRSAGAVITSLQKHLESIEKQITKLVSQAEEIKKINALLARIKGVSTVTSTSLQALLPELGRVSNKQIAALAGLAPYNRDSGKRTGARRIWGGRERVRRMLWMSAVCASTHNPRIRSFYERLVDAGKPVKVALTACMRKLLVICNAVVRDQVVLELNT